VLSRLSEISESALWLYLHDKGIGERISGPDLVDIADSVESLQGLRESIDPISMLLRNEALRNSALLVHRTMLDMSDEDLAKYEKEITRLRKLGIEVLCLSQEAYPEKLRLIRNPPLVIFRKGVFTKFNQGQFVAIAGTRQTSHRGHSFARQLAADLASRKYVIVSGLARGIDTEAHCGALDARGVTVAILPTSIEKVYPEENEELSIDITRSGALLSETSASQELEQRFARKRFVDRNRITSGISDVVVIVELGATKGSYHQFKFAMEQGKRVFVPRPENTNRHAQKGFVDLLSKGAVELRSSEDIVEYMEKTKDSRHEKSKRLDAFQS